MLLCATGDYAMRHRDWRRACCAVVLALWYAVAAADVLFRDGFDGAQLESGWQVDVSRGERR